MPQFNQATGAVGCDVVDPWADYQQVYWGGENTVDGVADNFPDQHLYGNFNQLRKLKAAHPGLKIEISLGGWTKSTWFASVAATPERRRAFVQACVDTFLKGNLPTGGWPENAGGIGAAAGIFDGIDLDWEYPTAPGGGNVDYGPADRHNATLLVQEFRAQLDALGAAEHQHYLLTAALPAARSSTKYYELNEFVRSLDWANIMTYDFNVPGGPTSAPNTLFFPDPRDPAAGDATWNTIGTVGYYLAQGIPANKIVVGVPFYGNQYLRAGGLYGPFDNTGLNGDSLAWDSKPQPSYHDLVDVAGFAGFTRNWNPAAGEPWLSGVVAHTLCDAAGANCQVATVPTVICYSDVRSIAERTAFVKRSGLRGVMAWELSQDSDDHALMTELAKVL